MDADLSAPGDKLAAEGEEIEVVRVGRVFKRRFRFIDVAMNDLPCKFQSLTAADADHIRPPDFLEKLLHVAVILTIDIFLVSDGHGGRKVVNIQQLGIQDGVKIILLE